MTITQNIPPSTLKEWLDTGEAVLIDVRENIEYKIEHIKESVHIPLSQLTPEKASLSTEKIKKLVIHCEAGLRGEKAYNALKQANINCEIWCLEGGIKAWKNAGHPTELSQKKILSLERQFQLTLGGLLLTFSALGFLINPNFFLAHLFIGTGLTFASLSGWCGLQKLIALMPWNK